MAKAITGAGGNVEVTTQKSMSEIAAESSIDKSVVQDRNLAASKVGVTASTNTDTTTNAAGAVAEAGAGAARKIGVNEEIPPEVLAALRGSPASTDTSDAQVLYVNPLTTAVVQEEDFVNGAAAGMNNLLIIGVDGQIYHRRGFSHDRHITTVMGKMFTPTPARVSKLKAGTQFLAYGNPIPEILLLQIVEFFKTVMRDKIKNATGAGTHGSYEAMAHIVWNNTTKQYRVAIPTQQVSQTSVRYDFDHITSDEEIILDIHSHNNMGAFFSGTDNGDDNNMVSISGVAGKLSSARPEFKWRFNYGKGQNIEIADVSELFAVQKPEITVPTEWMDKVTTTSYGSYGGGYSYGGYQGAARFQQGAGGNRNSHVGTGRNAVNGRSGGASDASRFQMGMHSGSAQSQGLNLAGSGRGKGRGKGKGKGRNRAATLSLMEEIERQEMEELAEMELLAGGKLNGGQYPNASLNVNEGCTEHGVTDLLDVDDDQFQVDEFEAMVTALMGGDDSTIYMDDDDDDNVGNLLGKPEGSENTSLVNTAFVEMADFSTLHEVFDPLDSESLEAVGFGVEELCHIAMFATDQDLRQFILIALSSHFDRLDFLRPLGVYPVSHEYQEDIPEILSDIIAENVTNPNVLADCIVSVQEADIQEDGIDDDDPSAVLSIN